MLAEERKVTQLNLSAITSYQFIIEIRDMSRFSFLATGQMGVRKGLQLDSKDSNDMTITETHNFKALNLSL